MSLTPSNMMPLGTVAPDFTLPDTTKNMTPVSLQELKSDRATVIMFICNHCPFVRHIQEEIARLASEYQPHGVSFIAISANDVENYPDDSPELMAEEAEMADYTFPYLYDETQDIAQAYNAACTPDIFVFDGKLECAYRGQFDGSRPGNDVPVTGEDLRAALDAMLSGTEVNPNQRPATGCNIKWKG